MIVAVDADGTKRVHKTTILKRVWVILHCLGKAGRPLEIREIVEQTRLTHAMCTRALKDAEQIGLTRRKGPRWMPGREILMFGHDWFLKWHESGHRHEFTNMMFRPFSRKEEMEMMMDFFHEDGSGTEQHDENQKE